MRYHNRQLAAWVTAAMICPAALAAGSISWWAAALETAAVCALLILMKAKEPIGTLELLPSAAWSALMTGYAAWLGASAFPALRESPVIALTILVLVWASLRAGAEVPARVSSVLVGFLIGLLGLMLGFGLEQVEPESFVSVRWSMNAAALLCLPLGAALLPAGKGRKLPIIGAAMCIGLSGLCALVAAKEGDLYLAAESISILGVMERVEGLLSAALAAGAFSLCTLIAAGGLQAAGKKEKKKEFCFWALAAAGLGLANRIEPGLILAGSLLFWVVLPLAALLLGREKKREKRC